MTVLLFHPPPAPVPCPPTPPSGPPTGPNIPGPYGPTLTVLRIGHPPRRQVYDWNRLGRVLNRTMRYALAWALLGWSYYWITDVHLSVAGLVLAAMLANPWRPRSGQRVRGARQPAGRRLPAAAISGFARRAAIKPTPREGLMARG